MTHNAYLSRTDITHTPRTTVAFSFILHVMRFYVCRYAFVLTLVVFIIIVVTIIVLVVDIVVVVVDFVIASASIQYAPRRKYKLKFL